MSKSADTIFAMLVRAAEAGAVCPSNPAMAEAIGASSVANGPRILSKLEKRGLIRVMRGACSRVVIITATGKRTAGEITTPHWSERGVIKSKPKPFPVNAQDEVGPGQVSVVHRDPCPWCGVRADVGCRHRWAA